ncbi:MAG: beta-lactamase [Acidobacteriales bacterium]|nr:beta-lactamase [Terriglobales bacterium]
MTMYTRLRAVAALIVFAAMPFGTSMKEAKTIDQQIDAVFAGISDNKSPGVAVLVRRDGNTLFQRGYGIRKVGSLVPIDSQTNFRLASCTKQFTAAAIMLLVRDGKLRYDEKLTEIFPDFPEYGRVITVRNLLNHTSGLPDYEELMDASSAGGPPKWTETHQISDAEVLALLKTARKGEFAPGTKWSYSNSGYVVLGTIVAKVSGMTFGDFLQQRIFGPLKMTHTVAYINGKNEVANRAFGHSKEPGNSVFKKTDQSSTSATLGDGGVYSNLDDLAKWDDALAHHTLLSAAETVPALTPVKLADGSLPNWASGPGDTDPQAGKDVSYGFGWFLDPYNGHKRMWHYGDTVGFQTGIVRFPEEKVTVIVLCNRSDLKPTELAAKVADLLLTRAN